MDSYNSNTSPSNQMGASNLFNNSPASKTSSFWCFLTQPSFLMKQSIVPFKSSLIGLSKPADIKLLNDLLNSESSVDKIKQNINGEVRSVQTDKLFLPTSEPQTCFSDYISHISQELSFLVSSKSAQNLVFFCLGGDSNQEQNQKNQNFQINHQGLMSLLYEKLKNLPQIKLGVQYFCDQNQGNLLYMDEEDTQPNEFSAEEIPENSDFVQVLNLADKNKSLIRKQNGFLQTTYVYQFSFVASNQFNSQSPNRSTVTVIDYPVYNLKQNFGDAEADQILKGLEGQNLQNYQFLNYLNRLQKVNNQLKQSQKFILQAHIESGPSSYARNINLLENLEYLSQILNKSKVLTSFSLKSKHRLNDYLSHSPQNSQQQQRSPGATSQFSNLQFNQTQMQTDNYNAKKINEEAMQSITEANDFIYETKMILAQESDNFSQSKIVDFNHQIQQFLDRVELNGKDVKNEAYQIRIRATIEKLRETRNYLELLLNNDQQFKQGTHEQTITSFNKSPKNHQFQSEQYAYTHPTHNNNFDNMATFGSNKVQKDQNVRQSGPKYQSHRGEIRQQVQQGAMSQNSREQDISEFKQTGNPYRQKQQNKDNVRSAQSKNQLQEPMYDIIEEERIVRAANQKRYNLDHDEDISDNNEDQDNDQDEDQDEDIDQEFSDNDGPKNQFKDSLNQRFQKRLMQKDLTGPKTEGVLKSRKPPKQANISSTQPFIKQNYNGQGNSFQNQSTPLKQVLKQQIQQRSFGSAAFKPSYQGARKEQSLQHTQNHAILSQEIVSQKNKIKEEIMMQRRKSLQEQQLDQLSRPSYAQKHAKELQNIRKKRRTNSYHPQTINSSDSEESLGGGSVQKVKSVSKMITSSLMKQVNEGERYWHVQFQKKHEVALELENQLSRLERQCQQQLRLINNQTQTIQKQGIQNKDLEQKKSSLTETIQQLQANNSALQEKLELSQQHSLSTESELNKFKDKVKGIKQQLLDDQKVNNVQKLELEKLNYQQDQQLFKTQQELELQTNQNQQLENEVLQLRQEYQDFQAEFGNLQQENKEKTDQNTEYRFTEQQLKQQVEELTKRCTQQEALTQKVESELKEKNLKMKEKYQARLAEKEAESNEYFAQLKEKEEQLSNQVSENFQFQKEADFNIQTINELNQKCQQIDNLQKEFQELSKVYKVVENDKNQLYGDNREQAELIQEYEKRNNELMTRLEEAESELFVSVQSENQKKDLIEDFKEEMSALQNDMASLGEKNKVLEQEIQSRELNQQEEYELIEKKIDQFLRELSIMKEENQKLMITNNTLSNKISQQQEALGSYKDKYQNKKIECKTLKAKLNAFGERLQQLEKGAEKELENNQRLKSFHKKKENKMQTIDDIRGMITQFRSYTIN